MATLIQNIPTQNWQTSPDNFGEVLTDEADILACVNNIIFTKKGDVPFNPRFGTDIYLYVDGPQNKVAPSIVAQIVQAVSSFEKRVRVDSVGASSDTGGNVTFTLYLTVIASSSQTKFIFNLSQIKQS